jgi:hypothetical protein
MATPCFRGLYGETQSCRSKLYLHISECNGCNCLDANSNKVLVNVEIMHGLDTDNAACKPWFAQVDAAIRSYISAVRGIVNKAKADECT